MHFSKRTKIAVYLLFVIVATGCFNKKEEKKPNPAHEEITARENVLQSIKKEGVLRVAVESDAPPFNWIDEDTGETLGFEYDLIKMVAREMGIDNVALVWTTDYEGIPEMISKKQDKADIFMGGYIPSASIENVVWSDTYFDGGYCLIVPDGSAIRRLRDLSGKKIGVYNDDEAEEFVLENVDSPLSVSRYDDSNENINWMMLHLIEPIAKKEKQELVDAIIYDYVFAKEEIKESNGRLKIVEFNLKTFPYKIGMPKNNYDLRSGINAALKKIMNGKAYVDLIKKYLDVDKTNVEMPELADNVKKHTVTQGETLSIIALKVLGDVERWNDIWNANKSRIPNPNLIHIGDILIIPEK